ncbi:MAG: aldehyde-activating protein [Gammaproteobacteria bacterium]|jgi:hypothetical protein|nr:MAG: aldehyde-activating protein [Gammaproteobacteria bacterium]
MHPLKGKCHCGNIRVAIELPDAPGGYGPRACDCEFCRKHGASYISDPHGSLRIEVETSRLLGKYRQGGEIADCIFCSRCGVLVGVLYQESGLLYAAVNSSILEDNGCLGAKISVSPKELTVSEKVRRWKELWFSNVSVIDHDV